MLAPCPALTHTLLQSPKPAKLEETLSPPSARTSESTLNMIARCAEHRVRVHRAHTDECSSAFRRELLSRELNTVQAQLADEERTLEPKLARLATASSRTCSLGVAPATACLPFTRLRIASCRQASPLGVTRPRTKVHSEASTASRLAVAPVPGGGHAHRALRRHAVVAISNGHSGATRLVAHAPRCRSTASHRASRGRIHSTPRTRRSSSGHPTRRFEGTTPT